MRLFLSRKPEVALTNLPQGSVPLNNAILSRYLCLLSISRIPLVHIAVALRSSGTVTLTSNFTLPGTVHSQMSEAWLVKSLNFELISFINYYVAITTRVDCNFVLDQKLGLSL